MNTIAVHRPSRSTLGMVAFGVVAAGSVAVLSLGVGSLGDATEAPTAPAPAVERLTDGPDWSEWQVRCLRVATTDAGVPAMCTVPRQPSAGGGRPGSLQ